MMNRVRSQRVLGGTISAAAMAVLYFFSPSQYHFYPRCPIYTYTHLLCPGCGGTRAMYELLHFHLRGALHYNALLTVLAPLGGLWFAFSWWRAVRDNVTLRLQSPRFAIATVILLTVLFTVARNTGIAF